MTTDSRLKVIDINGNTNGINLPSRSDCRRFIGLTRYYQHIQRHYSLTSIQHMLFLPSEMKLFISVWIIHYIFLSFLLMRMSRGSRIIRVVYNIRDQHADNSWYHLLLLIYIIWQKHTSPLDTGSVTRWYYAGHCPQGLLVHVLQIIWIIWQGSVDKKGPGPRESTAWWSLSRPMNGGQRG